MHELRQGLGSAGLSTLEALPGQRPNIFDSSGKPTEANEAKRKPIIVKTLLKGRVTVRPPVPSGGAISKSLEGALRHCSRCWGAGKSQTSATVPQRFRRWPGSVPPRRRGES